MGKSKKDFWGQPIEPSDGTDHHVPKKTRSTKLILTILTLLIIGGVSGCVIMVDNGYLDPEGSPSKTLTLILGIAIVGLGYTWNRWYFKNHPTGWEIEPNLNIPPDGIDLPFDNPRVDYGGYRISNPKSMYAARNLPPSNNPIEIQGRKWQMRYELSSGRAPEHNSRVGNGTYYYRQCGQKFEEWDTKKSKKK